MSELVGVLPVDKPEGPTSHDVVAMARRALRTRRIGHTGTLDPFASGLLLLCVGPATRLAEYLTGLPKRYTATIRLGRTTDTDDLTGDVLEESDGWRTLDRLAVDAAVARQAGTIAQVPPMFSAKRVGGERLYRAARRGESVERAPVEVEILSIEVTRFEPPEVDISVECSSGTYIRAIARDVGADLGVGGHLTRLRRTAIGARDVRGALPVDALDDPSRVADAMLSPADAMSHLPRVALPDADVTGVRNGRPVALADVDGEQLATDDGLLALIAPDGALLAIAERKGDRLQPRKVFT